MPASTFENISSDLKKRSFAPVYFFCGEEEYFIDALTDLVEASVLNDMEKAFNQTIAYGKDLNARQIIETCGRLPMMAERQLVIVKEAQTLSLKEDEEQLYLRYIRNPVKSTVLVFAWKHGKPDGRKSFGKEIAKSAVYFESKPLFENQVAPWIKGWLSMRKYNIEEDAAELLVEFTGSDLSKVTNELEKLILNKQKGSAINVEDIEKGVGVSKEFSVFELSNALGAKNKTKAFQIVNYFGSNPKSGPLVLVLGTMYGYFMKLYLAQQHKSASDKDLASVLKINPFFLKDYKPAIRNFNEKQLEQIFYLLEEYDLRSKGVNNHNVKENELLREMVARILQ